MCCGSGFDSNIRVSDSFSAAFRIRRIRIRTKKKYGSDTLIVLTRKPLYSNEFFSCEEWSGYRFCIRIRICISWWCKNNFETVFFIIKYTICRYTYFLNLSSSPTVITRLCWPQPDGEGAQLPGAGAGRLCGRLPATDHLLGRLPQASSWSQVKIVLCFYWMLWSQVLRLYLS